MTTPKKMYRGQLVDLTESEIAQMQAAAEAAAADKIIMAATNAREKRNAKLSDSDWTQMNDSPLTNEQKTAWATYRQELRDISDLDAWPNLANEDWPVEP